MLALFDIDGVLANDKHRTPLAMAKRWAEYFQTPRMIRDGVWPEGRALLQAHLDAGDEVGYLTGRREDRRRITELWLRRNGFPLATPGDMLMRQMGDKRILAEVKLSKIMELRSRGKTVVLYEDDPFVVERVNEGTGEKIAVLCTWSVKEVEMIKTGQT